MSDDIVKRLRAHNSWLLSCGQDHSDVLLDAALAIEQRDAEIARLRAERDAHASGRANADSIAEMHRKRSEAAIAERDAAIAERDETKALLQQHAPTGAEPRPTEKRDWWAIVVLQRRETLVARTLSNKLAEALRPLAKAADKADDLADEIERLGQGRLTDNASPGLGIKFGQLRAARAALAEYDAANKSPPVRAGSSSGAPESI